MRLFDTNVQELKYKVLKEVIRLNSRGDLEKKLYEIPKTIVPGPKATMRCCIYRERAIVEERVKLAMGGNPENKNIVEVIDIACDECPNTRFLVTEACRGCIAHRCQAVCPSGAISFENQKAKIDTDKCKECGQCMKVCPYSAILEQQRPCVRGCKAKAITLDEEKKAKINEDKCINCGTCVYQCPFGAITDKSFVLDIMKILKNSEGGKKYRVYAAIAPAIASQFTYAKIGQVVAGLKKIGFSGVAEVAFGANITAEKEAGELAEKGFLTSSCCPSFVKYIEINFPELKSAISSNLSPMAETAAYIKQLDKTAKVVFIGPCISKKKEFQKEQIAGLVDSVMTFEELQAFFDGLDIDLEKLPEEDLENASYFGRVFARSGGVSEALANEVKKSGKNIEFNPEICDGLLECRAALLKAAHGKLGKNFIEGMACEGGCIGGAACLSHAVRNKAQVDKYAGQATGDGIHFNLNIPTNKE